MKIGIGLPNHVAGVSGSLVVEWARRAEERGFDSVTTIDRLVYPSVDSIVALALAAGASERLELVTNIVLAPLYPTAVLAKQLASVASASGERLIVGVGVGSRDDDYRAVDVDFSRRGRLLDDAARMLSAAWRGEPNEDGIPLVPEPVRVPLLFGGKSAATLRRATLVGDGWVAGALRDYPVQSAFAEEVRAGWREAGRPGEPVIHASVNFAIGDTVTLDAGRETLSRYYGFNPDYAALNVADLVVSAQDVRDTVRAYSGLGFDRLLFHPTVTGADQVDRLADALH
jgi:alkanesulfonate monooxygenase SsuD/methylene tetrahydromethanopterin reductase-like flavin-dependent oxidoreductase (luciferase family)